ncbi:MAG TPA: GAF domain-containing sensor histidine kinase [Actinomycetota bacterium]|nr:GAF domain-containing sensor histidine kinase [Actinomycetota bacterium]
MHSIEAENRLLRRAIEAITSSVDLDAVLRASVDLVTEATGGDVCFLHLWDEEGQCLVLRAASAGFEEAVGRVRLRLEEGVAGWVAAHRDIVVIPEDKWADPRYKYIPELRGELFTSLLSVPIVSPTGGLIGVFNVHSRRAHAFSEQDVGFLRLTASLVAGAIEHTSLFARLAEKERALEDLMRRTIEAQEEERRRVATEIHDGVTQQLVSVWYRLQAARRAVRSAPERAERELATAQGLVDEALEDARVAIHDLRPTVLDDLGLVPSLRALALRQLEGEVELELDLEEGLVLPPHHEVALYRITQEAVNNVRKHAEARRVRVSLRGEEGDEVVLVVEDDGRGFERGATEKAGPRVSFGLQGMAERAALAGGVLTVDSAPGKGTRLEVRIPRQLAGASEDRR